MLLTGMLSGTATMKNCLAVFFLNLKMHPPYNSVVVILGMCPTVMKTYAHTKNLYMNVYGRFIYINQPLKTA